jgi:hypothetical protein
MGYQGTSCKPLLTGGPGQFGGGGLGGGAGCKITVCSADTVESVMDSLSYGQLGKDGTGARALPLLSRRDGDEGAHGRV